MITELLAALSAIPKIANSLDRLAGTVAQLNARAVKARAAERRSTKDDEIEKRIAALVDTSPVKRMPGREAGEHRAPDGSPLWYLARPEEGHVAARHV